MGQVRDGTMVDTRGRGRQRSMPARLFWSVLMLALLPLGCAERPQQPVSVGGSTANRGQLVPAVAVSALAPRWLRVEGVAAIAVQTGTGLAQRRQQAREASRLRAYQALVSQLYGLELQAESQLDNALLVQDRVRAEIQGMLRGARVVAQYPRGDALYVTVLEVELGQAPHSAERAAP